MLIEIEKCYCLLYFPTTPKLDFFFDIWYIVMTVHLWCFQFGCFFIVFHYLNYKTWTFFFVVWTYTCFVFSYKHLLLSKSELSEVKRINGKCIPTVEKKKNVNILKNYRNIGDQSGFCIIMFISIKCWRDNMIH